MKKAGQIKKLFILAAILFGVFVFTPKAHALTLSQNGITWTISGSPQSGTFYLGDPWVVGPVTITSISPGWDGSINGSMINPDAAPSSGDGWSNAQGYSTVSPDIPYNSSLNVGTSSSISINPGNYPQGVASLVSTIGIGSPESGGSHEFLQSAAVLTVLSSAPPQNAFRPSYARGDKTIYTTSQVNLGLLPRLQAPGSASGVLGSNFTKVYLDHGSGGGNWGSSMHPKDNGLPYGRDFSTEMSNVALLALTNNSQADTAAIRIVQIGIDFYPMWLVNDRRKDGGGFGYGEKWPILFAGLMLGNQGMQHLPDNKFGEDRWTQYSGGNVYWTLSPSDPEAYECQNVGNEDCTTNNNSGYRICCSSHTWVGQALAARLMGACGLWNHPAFFDYIERWVSTPSDWVYGDTDNYGDIYGFGGTFVRDMWETYRVGAGGGCGSSTVLTCSQLGGNLCSSGQACQGGNFRYSSDSTSGSLCCVGGTCQTPSPTPTPRPTPTPTPTPPRTYTITDFTNLASNWLRTVSSSTANVNADGRVNTRDLGIMMSNWQ